MQFCVYVAQANQYLLHCLFALEFVLVYASLLWLFVLVAFARVWLLQPRCDILCQCVLLSLIPSHFHSVALRLSPRFLASILFTQKATNCNTFGCITHQYYHHIQVGYFSIYLIRIWMCACAGIHFNMLVMFARARNYSCRVLSFAHTQIHQHLSHTDTNSIHFLHISYSPLAF